MFSPCILFITHLPGLLNLLVMLLEEETLAELESPKCQRNSAGAAVSSATAKKVTSVFVG